MNFQEKIQQLRAEINRQLEPLIGEKCILTDLPYHDNLGDVLIWQGELDFLRNINRKPESTSSSETFLFPTIPDHITILLHGGGNFGDLYRNFQEFRIKVIRHYPNNRIIMFPQSVWYEDESLIEKDAKIFAAHKNLYLCARDRWSYEFMKKHFSTNNILLVPDMAFCINDKRLKVFRGKNVNKTIYFNRIDKERQNISPIEISYSTDIKDWPKYGEKTIGFKFMIYSSALIRRLNKLPFIKYLIATMINSYAEIYWRPSRVTLALKFLCQYEFVITTRLHALFLAILLYIPVKFIDNTTGKLSAFYNQWLSDIDNVSPFNSTVIR